MDLLSRMVEHHVWLVGQMLARLVGQLAMWDTAIHDRPYDFDAERHETVAQMRTKLAVVGPAFLAEIRAIIDGRRLDEAFADAACDPPEVFTHGGMIAHVLTFAAHRRTLVCGALADAGITDLGAGDPMRWVADHAA
jgi:AraC family transcriptional regulator